MAHTFPPSPLPRPCPFTPTNVPLPPSHHSVHSSPQPHPSTYFDTETTDLSTGFSLGSSFHSILLFLFYKVAQRPRPREHPALSSHRQVSTASSHNRALPHPHHSTGPRHATTLSTTSSPSRARTEVLHRPSTTSSASPLCHSTSVVVAACQNESHEPPTTM